MAFLPALALAFAQPKALQAAPQAAGNDATSGWTAPTWPGRPAPWHASPWENGSRESASLARARRPGGSGGALSEGGAFLSSLVVPGLAQHRQDRRRWVLYAGAELLGAAAYLLARSEAHALRRDYRDFAWAAARAGLSAEPRLDGGFEYYERLTRWTASGLWDADPAAPGLQPESDPRTYNGSVWTLAMQIYGVDPAAPGASPGYASALDHYREHGYGASYLWAWRAGSGDQDRFADLIARSDGRFRDARLALGVLVANHLVSAVDGFITARLRVLRAGRASALVVAIPAP